MYGTGLYRGSLLLRNLVVAIALVALGSAFAADRSLPDILRAGLKNDPGVLEAKANERVAQSRLEQSEAAKYPTLSARGNQPLVQSGNDDRSFSPALEARWTVYDFGKRDAQIRRDQIKTEYFAHKTNETAQEFLYTLAGHYLEALKATLLLEVAEADLARHQKILNKIKIIVEIDPGRRSERTQAESRMLQVRENILAYKRMQGLALSRVARYVNPEVTPAELRDPFTKLDSAALQKRYPVGDQELQQNPSYVAQAEELESIRAELEAAKLSRWPDINLLGQAQRRNSAVYLSVNFDLLDATKSPSIDEKEFQVNAAGARLDKIKLNLVERAQLALLQMQEDQLRIKLADQQIKSSKQVASDYELQFEIAQRSLLDVLNAYSEIAGIERMKAEAQYDLMAAKLDYLSAAGKISDWAGLDDISAVDEDGQERPSQKTIFTKVRNHDTDDLKTTALGKSYFDVNKDNELVLIKE